MKITLLKSTILTLLSTSVYLSPLSPAFSQACQYDQADTYGTSLRQVGGTCTAQHNLYDGHRPIDIAGNAYVTFEDNITVSSGVSGFNLNIQVKDNSTAHFKKNLLMSNWTNAGRGMYIISGHVQIDGDLVASRDGLDNRGAVLSAQNNATITINGNTHLYTTDVSADAIRSNSGSVLTFKGHTLIEVLGYGATANNSALHFNTLDLSSTKYYVALSADNRTLITSDGRTTITTSQNSGHGIVAKNGSQVLLGYVSGANTLPAPDGPTVVNLANALIKTSGEGSIGVIASGTDQLNASINLTESAEIAQTGKDSIGIRLDTTGAGVGSITSNGVVNSSGTNSSAIVFGSDNSPSKVILKSNSSTTGATHALLNTSGDSDILIESGAKVSGAIELGDGSDVLVIEDIDLSKITKIDGGDDTDPADGFIDSLEFKENQNRTYTAENITNWEKITFNGGLFTLTGDILTTNNLSLINNSQLDITQPFTIASDTKIDASSRLQFNGAGDVSYIMDGLVANAGTISLRDGNSGDILNISGDYIGGAGSRVEIDTVLGNDDASHDAYHVAGNASGSSILGVYRSSQPMDVTSGHGIPVFMIDGNSDLILTLDGDYSFNGEDFVVINGLYVHKLFKGGLNTLDDYDTTLKNWYLRTVKQPIIDPDPEPEPDQPGLPIYEAYPDALLAMIELPTMQQRVGNRKWQEEIADGEIGQGLWARISGKFSHHEPVSSSSAITTDAHLWQLQVGIDHIIDTNDYGSWIAAVTAQYTTSSTNIFAELGDGSINAAGFGIGATVSWLGNDGLYMDAQAQLTRFNSNLFSNRASKYLISGNGGFGSSLGVEVGKKIDLDKNWSVTPQAQITYANAHFDNFVDTFYANIAPSYGQSIKIRAGLSLDYENTWLNENGTTDSLHAYGIANVISDLASDRAITANHLTFSSRKDPIIGQIGFGGTMNFNDDLWALYGEASVATGLTDIGTSWEAKALAGLRLKF